MSALASFVACRGEDTHFQEPWRWGRLKVAFAEWISQQCIWHLLLRALGSNSQSCFCSFLPRDTTVGESHKSVRHSGTRSISRRRIIFITHCGTRNQRHQGHRRHATLLQSCALFGRLAWLLCRVGVSGSPLLLLVMLVLGCLRERAMVMF